MKHSSLFVYVRIFFVAFVMTLAVSSCLNMNHQGEGNDIPTQGEVTMHFDRNDSFVVDQLIHQFELEYPKARIHPVYLSHQELMDLLNRGEIKGVFLHRSFTNQDKNVLEKRKIKLRSVMVYKSSSAFICNKSLSTVLDYRKLLDWLAGDDCLPFQSLVLYGKGGRILESLDSLLSANHKSLKRKVVSVSSPYQVIKSVSENAHSLGSVGINWLADEGDSWSMALRKKIKVLGFLPLGVALNNSSEVNGMPVFDSTTSTMAAASIVYPMQSQIADRSYPFIEPVWGYDLQGYSGLVSGFLAYVCSHPGQVLIKKSGLYPALPPHRTIEIQ